MSAIFEALIYTAFDEKDAIIELENLMKSCDPERCQVFKQIDMASAGGTKYFSDRVYAGCFNYFTPYDIEQCIIKTKWNSPCAVAFTRNAGDYYYEGEPDVITLTVEQMRNNIS